MLKAPKYKIQNTKSSNPSKVTYFHELSYHAINYYCYNNLSSNYKSYYPIIICPNLKPSAKNKLNKPRKLWHGIQASLSLNWDSMMDALII